jgi:hypothetical protein
MRRAGTRIVIAGMLTCAAVSVTEGQKRTHLNPMIELHAQKKPIFGLYAPSNPRGRGNRGGANSPAPAAGAEDAGGTRERRSCLRQE